MKRMKVFQEKRGMVRYISLSYSKVGVLKNCPSPTNKIVPDNQKIILIERNVFITTIAASFNRLNELKCPLNKA